MNLLIIDDEPLILNTVYDQLKKEKLNMERIDMAGSAQEARNMLGKCYYHIFLCDIVMPWEDGITFAKWVLEKYPECKFIFLTAHADFEYMKDIKQTLLVLESQNKEQKNIVSYIYMDRFNDNKELNVEEDYEYIKKALDVEYID